MTQPTFKEFVRKIKGLLKVADKYDLGNTSDLLSDDKTNYIVKPDGIPHNLTDNIKSVNSVKPKTGTNSITIPTIAKIVDETGTEHNITKVGQEVVLNHIPSKSYTVIDTTVIDTIVTTDGVGYTSPKFRNMIDSTGFAISNNKLYPLSVYNDGDSNFLGIETTDEINHVVVTIFDNDTIIPT